MTEDRWPVGTTQAAAVVSVAVNRCLTERQVNALLRRRPDIRPPLVGGRRLWSEKHVRQVIDLVLGADDRGAA